jgi:hypothetical protein
VNRIFALTLPAMMAILNLSSVAVLWFGGRLVSNGSLPIGNLTAFLAYILQILVAVMMAVMMAILLPRAVASAERVEQVLDTVPAIADPPRPLAPIEVSGLVRFEHVTFGYPGSERPVLRELSFAFEPGGCSLMPQAARTSQWLLRSGSMRLGVSGDRPASTTKGPAGAPKLRPARDRGRPCAPADAPDAPGTQARKTSRRAVTQAGTVPNLIRS